MIKRIKRYFKIKYLLLLEIVETICTICLYLEHAGRSARNPYSEHMSMHFQYLKELSDALKEDIAEKI